MTALEKYIRLEALGVWREAHDAQAREVVVGFGESTLVLTDLDERPLGHWALAGVQAIARDAAATVYAMSPEGSETLAIEDCEMIEAIATVTQAHWRAPEAPPPRRRRWWPAILGAVLLGAAATAAPAFIREQAALMMPQESLEEIGDQMLLRIMATSGPPCGDPAGQRVLTQLADRLGAEAFRTRVIGIDAPLALLPGPTVLIGRDVLTQAEDPAEIAGWIALAMAREHMSPGRERLVSAVGLAANLRYVLTGRLSDPALARAVRSATHPLDAQEVQAAYDHVTGAGLSAAPFVDGLRRAGEPAPAALAEGQAAMSDQEWVTLKGICG